MSMQATSLQPSNPRGDSQELRSGPGGRGRRARLRCLRLIGSATLAAMVFSGCGVPLEAESPQSGGAGPMYGDGWSAPKGRGMMMGGRGMMMGDGCGMMGHSMQRHRQAMMGGLPPAYRRLRNPYPADARVLSVGEDLYQANCAACHGERGLGDGPAAATLSPRPANLRWMARMPMASDGYLMWTISEGGAAFGSAMPAFKDSLSEEARWRIIRYLRTLDRARLSTR